jgi:hypothetical protein
LPRRFEPSLRGQLVPRSARESTSSERQSKSIRRKRFVQLATSATRSMYTCWVFIAIKRFSVIYRSIIVIS